MTYKIEKNVPMGLASKYPFSDMEVGDSFFIPVGQQYRVRAGSIDFGKRNPGVKFSIRKDGDGYRCWRTA